VDGEYEKRPTVESQSRSLLHSTALWRSPRQLRSAQDEME